MCVRPCGGLWVRLAEEQVFTNPVTSSFCHSLRIYYHQALWSEEIQIKKERIPIQRILSVRGEITEK